MLNKIKGLVKEEQGQGMTEYGLLLAVVIVVVLAGLLLFKSGLRTLFTNVGNKLRDAVDTTTTTVIN